MKKIYFAPEMELVELKTTSCFLAGSGLDDIDNGGSDGGIGGSDKDPSDTSQPGWSEGF